MKKKKVPAGNYCRLSGTWYNNVDYVYLDGRHPVEYNSAAVVPVSSIRPCCHVG